MKTINLSHFLSVCAFLVVLTIPFGTYAENLEVTISASPQTIDKGDQSTLSWNSEGAVECKIIGKGIMANGGSPKSSYVGLGSGIIPVEPEKTTTYSISCKGKDNTFTPAQGQVTVTVEGTNDSADGSEGSSGSSSDEEDFNFTAGCVVNPERARRGELVTFTATSVGGEGTLHYQWSGDVVGGGQKIFDTFTSSGTKTATLTVTDSRDIKVVTACNVFIEPSTDVSGTTGTTGGTGTQTSPTGSSGQTAAGGGTTQTQTPGDTGNGDTQTDTSQVAAASEGGGGTLFLVLLVSIVVNMAALFYFFVYAKKKKEEKALMEEEARLADGMATA
ncbi:MAG: hypothetical protein COU47_03790 [Candidatus Niyogibacteria bacterium CG10_big_fil_rev_8_21_14_0_10_46_36]|uniref:Uncharacterized protein n=1 Tax=Candidatus Niyogibacteria bacterium CG10_big_fil_rev_8_21_14_0_10_46_36 TaxID=1974726 RepID=A0A2H0TCB5_9BACT|nr:MAG: hypothetical protein COU47_03790 [Candidatus Niyogibacteria bacterium CG10_big_fil_rev_8_21_14_0_10_46_36]